MTPKTCPCQNKTPGQEDATTPAGSTNKVASGVIVYLMEELTDARMRAEQVGRYLQRAQEIIDHHPHKDQFYAAAGDIINGISDAFFRMSKALDATALSAARLDYEEIKQNLRPEKVEELEEVLKDVRLRTVQRRSQPDPDADTSDSTSQATTANSVFQPQSVQAQARRAWDHPQGHTMTTPAQALVSPASVAAALTEIANEADHTGKLPIDKLAGVIASLEGSGRTRTASQRAAGVQYLRSLAASLSAPGVSKLRLAASLRQLIGQELTIEAEDKHQGGAGQEFQKTNPGISDEEAAQIDRQHEKNKDNFKAAGRPRGVVVAGKFQYDPTYAPALLDMIDTLLEMLTAAQKEALKDVHAKGDRGALAFFENLVRGEKRWQAAWSNFWNELRD